MARFGRFEVKREMRDVGSGVKSDDKKNNQHRMSDDFLADLDGVGFDFEEEEVITEQESVTKVIEIQLDDKGNPLIPDDWTYLRHGSSLDRWDESVLGGDVIVGNRTVDGKPVIGRPLSCIERSVAKRDYERGGVNTAKTYGGKEQAFEIRVLLYKDPRLGEGKGVRDKLSPEQVSDITKYYTYQGGRHPAVPTKTKLTFLKTGDFDDITNTEGNNIYWYIPEQYLEQYLEEVEQMQTVDRNITNDSEERSSSEEKNILTHNDVEEELNQYYDDSIPTATLEAYLAERITKIYGQRLEEAGITDINKFLEGKLKFFEGVESYRELIGEIESVIEFSESVREQTPQEGVVVEETIQEEDRIVIPAEEKPEETTFLSAIKGQVVDNDREYGINAAKIEKELQAKTPSIASVKKGEI